MRKPKKQFTWSNQVELRSRVAEYIKRERVKPKHIFTNNILTYKRLQHLLVFGKVVFKHVLFLAFDARKANLLTAIHTSGKRWIEL